MELKDLKVGDKVLYYGGYGDNRILTVLDITKSGYIKAGYMVGKKKVYGTYSQKTGLQKGNTISNQHIVPITPIGIIEEKKKDFVKEVVRKYDSYKNITFEQALVIARTLHMFNNEFIDKIEEDCKR